MESVIEFDASGAVRFVCEPEASRVCESLGSQTKRRASHVEPVNWILRLAFRAVRCIVPDDSRVAQWSRSWRVRWRVAIVGGPVLPGVWVDRLEAIKAEVEWLNENGFNHGERA